MAELTDKQKRYAVIGAGGLVLLYLLYRWYASRQASSTATTAAGTTAPDTSASDYASLAGQEQGDMASLQSQLAALAAQIPTGGGTSAADPGTSTVTPAGPDLTGITSTLGDIQGQIAALSMGAQPASPSAVAAAITTHKGGPFYNYYVTVTGRPPPASVNTSNWIYQAWRQGIKPARIAYKPAPHPSSKNTNIGHPNNNHQAQTQVAHPNTPPRPAAPPPKPPPPVAAKPAPKPKPPPPKSKPKASGKRK
jgi:hypothetical protein